MTNDQFYARLVSDLKPVRRRSALADSLIVAALFALELIIFLAVGMARSDMPVAMEMPSFWWKLGSCGIIALCGAMVAISSFDPVASPLRGLRWLLVIVFVCVGAGWFVDAAQNGAGALIARLDWQSGLQCVYKMMLLSMPPVIGLGWLMRRGAPTHPGATALAVGVAAAAWGAFVFVFACPSDDPLYIAVWYLVGCGLLTLLTRVLLPRLTRW
jgi:hypothetical protein